MLSQDIFLTNPQRLISSRLQSETADGCVSDLNVTRLGDGLCQLSRHRVCSACDRSQTTSEPHH